MQAYSNFVRTVLGFLTGSYPREFNVSSGAAQLEDAFEVFNQAKSKALTAIDTLQAEQDKIQADIKALQEEFDTKMACKTTDNDELSAQKVKAQTFISKINNIIE